MLAAQQIIQRGDFIKVTGIKQITDSLVVLQRQEVVVLVQKRRRQVEERPQRRGDLVLRLLQEAGVRGGDGGQGGDGHGRGRRGWSQRAVRSSMHAFGILGRVGKGWRLAETSGNTEGKVTCGVET